MKKNTFKNKFVQQVVSLLIFIVLAQTSIAKETIYLSETPVYQHKIAVVTNRSVIQLNNDSILFESKPDESGHFSYLTASYSEDQWNFKRNNSLAELLNQNFEYENWLIFVHGDGKDLKSAVQRAKEIQKLHHVNVLVYAWPSRNPDLGAIRNFKNSLSNVEKATVHFSEFLHKVEDIRSTKDNSFSSGNLSMFFHSLGNYYLENLVEKNLHADFDQPFIDNLIINAAAVEQEEHYKWVERLNFQYRIYINSNGKDMNLIGLRVFSSMGMQLGEDPEPPLASNAFYVNFTNAVGASLPPGPSHSYFFASVTDESERIKTYYSEIINGLEVDFSNPQMFNTNPKYLAYSIKF
jgi:hypothetical protein